MFKRFFSSIHFYLDEFVVYLLPVSYGLIVSTFVFAFNRLDIYGLSVPYLVIRHIFACQIFLLVIWFIMFIISFPPRSSLVFLSLMFFSSLLSFYYFSIT